MVSDLISLMCTFIFLLPNVTNFNESHNFNKTKYKIIGNKIVKVLLSLYHVCELNVDKIQFEFHVHFNLAVVDCQCLGKIMYA